jgi:hypothetical protein
MKEFCQNSIFGLNLLQLHIHSPMGRQSTPIRSCCEGLNQDSWCLLSADVYYATFILVDSVGPPSAEFCRTVANFTQVDDLRFINPWEA